MAHTTEMIWGLCSRLAGGGGRPKTPGTGKHKLEKQVTKGKTNEDINYNEMRNDKSGGVFAAGADRMQDHTTNQ